MVFGLVDVLRSVKSAREDLLATLKGKDMKSRDRAVKLYTQRCEAFILMVQVCVRFLGEARAPSSPYIERVAFRR